MRARELIFKQKRITKAGEWKSGQKMPKTAFPMSASRSFQLGPKWTWRVDVLEYKGEECRLLIAFEPMKQTAIAWLSCRRGNGYALVSQFEFHGDHPGWHCHSYCGAVADISVGYVKSLDAVRLPKPRTYHRRGQYELTEQDALAKAFAFYKVGAAEPGSLGI
jgi:hypothetical protein